MVESEFTERRRQVLRAVLDDYIRTAEPVGSRVVARRYPLGLSPATIRNTMADLEELGYLTQPHTSAGRVPTDRAYRFYVDNLRSRERPTQPTVPFTPPSEIESLMVEISHHLSAASRLTGMVLAPPLKTTILERVEMIPLDGKRILAVVITESGWLTTKVLTVESEVSSGALREFSRILTDRFGGRTFESIQQWVAQAAQRPEDPDPAVRQIEALARQVFAVVGERNLYLSGVLNILDQPEFSEVQTMKDLLRTLEAKEKLIDLLTLHAESPGVQVLIGRENPYGELQDFSLVTSTYSAGDRVLGILGVVGPRRMLYAEIVSLVEETATLMGQWLRRLTEAERARVRG